MACWPACNDRPRSRRIARSDPPATIVPPTTRFATVAVASRSDGRHEPVPDADGRCLVCFRVVARYTFAGASRLEHRRGRIPGISPARIGVARRPRRRRRLAPLVPLEAMLAAGRCDCGAPLDDHPPLPRIRAWAEGRPCSRPVGWTLSSGGMGR